MVGWGKTVSGVVLLETRGWMAIVWMGCWAAGLLGVDGGGCVWSMFRAVV